MSVTLNKNIADIGEYFAKFPTNSSKNKTEFNLAYKKFHSLLIWGHCLESSSGLHLLEKQYFKETISDISHSIFLLNLNLYKPSRFSLRSAIENFLRCVLSSRDVDVTTMSTVFALFDETNVQFEKDGFIKQRIGVLRGEYRELCKSAHSVTIDYMSQTIPWNDIVSVDDDAFESVSKCLKTVCKNTNEILFVAHNERLALTGHKNADLVMDSLPSGLKKEIADRTAK